LHEKPITYKGKYCANIDVLKVTKAENKVLSIVAPVRMDQSMDQWMDVPGDGEIDQ